MGTGFFPESDAAHTHHLVPRLRMRGTIPPLPLHAFMAWTGTILLSTPEDKSGLPTPEL
jgi:hypothetical protein